MNDRSKKLLSRRQFARRAAVLSATASLTPAAAIFPETPEPNEEAQLPDNLPKLAPQGVAESEARYQLIFSRHGSEFTDEEKNSLRTLSSMVQPSLDRLRGYALKNGNVPALFLKAIVEREKKSGTSTTNFASAKLPKKA